MSNNLDNWLTKQQVAQLLCVAEKTVDRMAKAGDIQKAMRKRSGLPPLAVYHPDDVARMKSERSKPLAPFVMPNMDVGQVVDVPDGQVSDGVSKLVHGQVFDMSMAMRNPFVSALEVIADRAARTGWPAPLWMTEREAARYTGLGIGYIRSRLTGQKIGPRGALVYRRSDLDSL